MFDFNKESIQNNADKLAKESHQVVNEVADRFKKTASTVSDTVSEKTESFKDQAQLLVEQLKGIVHQATVDEAESDFKNQVMQKVNALQSAISDEATLAYQSGKQRTIDVVKDNPIGTIAVAAGVGLLLGYVLGSKQSSK